MKKIISLVVLVLMVLFVVGCATNNPETAGIDQRKGANDAAANAAAAAKAQLEQRYAALDSQITQDSNTLKSELFKGGDKVVFSSTFERGSFGDLKAVVVGIRNDQSYTTNFKLVISVKDAYDTMKNSIEYDENSMRLWIDTKTNLGPLSVDTNKYLTVPIYFNIKDIKEGVAPKKGTYVFHVEVKEGTGADQTSLYGKSDIAILVQ